MTTFHKFDLISKKLTDYIAPKVLHLSKIEDDIGVLVWIVWGCSKNVYIFPICLLVTQFFVDFNFAMDVD